MPEKKAKAQQVLQPRPTEPQKSAKLLLVKIQQKPNKTKAVSNKNGDVQLGG